MTDYSAMSDFEINYAISKITGDADFVTYENPTPDYCNNPADAWPIMLEHGIGVDYDGISWTASDWRENKHSDWRNHPEHPLRLAMIVFLMMKESSHAKT
ncbi:phage protein NinX family protein [Yersinia hibernica]|uniref:phage protein NinX family protein n=1 Tax=Yersinia hibernica TaxID=2339259 RepID=UPI0011A89A28|nr:phage protein NinX family protein [Yersinia hibernica]